MRQMYLHWAFVALALPLVGAEPADRVNVAFSDPSRPGLLKVNTINGGITVRAYDGKEVIIEARSGGRESHRDSVRRDGLRRVPVSSGLRVEEENNVMSVTIPPMGTAQLDIQVPEEISLNLRTINDGDIVVEGVRGEIEVNNINGSVTLNRVSGSVVAHALNGRVAATFVQVDPQKPMSFSSLNGDIDVTFPPTLKANVKFKTDRGDVFSDFDITTQAPATTVVEDSRSTKGKYRVRVERVVQGTINGGGPEIQFGNFNGSIYIRKGK